MYLYLQIIWKYFFNASSAGEHDTLYQLRNLINHSNVGKTIIHNFDLCDDFIEIVITVHILCATLETTGMESLGSIPSEDLIPLPDTVWTKTFSERKEILVVMKHI